MKLFDLENRNNVYVVSGMLKMIEEEGLSVEEVYERLEQIKSGIHFALVEAEKKSRYEKNARLITVGVGRFEQMNLCQYITGRRRILGGRADGDTNL